MFIDIMPYLGKRKNGLAKKNPLIMMRRFGILD